MHRCRTGLIVALTIVGTCLAGAQTSSSVEPMCPGGSAPNPNVLFCDNFESTGPLVAPGRYFEHGNNNGDFVPVNGVGVGSSRGMRGIFQAGEVDAGSLKLAFGRNPGSRMTNGIRVNEDFREIYYRMYLRMQTGWSGDPFKLSRATSIVGSNWAQAMIAHLWSDGNLRLLIDPARCVNPTTSQPKCTTYNDFPNIDWLGNRSGTTQVFATANANRWYCVEHHVRLNTPGQSNGIEEFWVDGNLEARRADLNFVASYTQYAINAVFFENWWNTGSPRLQERYFDNIVVSTQPIGCLGTAPTAPRPPANVRVVRS